MATVAIAMPTRSPIKVGCSPMCRAMANMVLAVRIASSNRPAATSLRKRAWSAARPGLASVCTSGSKVLNAVGLELQQDLPVGTVEPGSSSTWARPAAVLPRPRTRQLLKRHRQQLLAASNCSLSNKKRYCSR